MSPDARLAEHLARVAEANPNSIAVDFGHDVTTYGELALRASSFIEHLEIVPAGQRGVVAVCLHKRRPLYDVYWGLATAGASIVPLDPAWPIDRRRRAMELSGARVLVSEHSDAHEGPHFVISPDGGSWTVSGPRQEATSEQRFLDPETAYVMLTSGSTGVPKAVPIGRGALYEYAARAVHVYDVNQTSRISHTFNTTFDPSMLDIFMAWVGGARLCVPRGREHLAVSSYVQTRGITHWISVPSLIEIAERMNQLNEAALKTLRFSMFGGEALTWRHVDIWQRHAPQAVIENLYGPTELLISCASYRVPEHRAARPATSNDTVPIGRVYDHLDWRLEGGQTFGELSVRGSQRFSGYLDDEKRYGPEDWYATGDLVSVESDLLVFRGRRDDQVKVLGHRVELGEIEQTLRACAGVSSAAAVLVDVPEPGIVAFYCGEGVDDRVLRASLASALPSHAMPRSVLHIDALPLTDNGKTNRAALSDRLRQLQRGGGADASGTGTSGALTSVVSAESPQGDRE